MFFVKRFFSSFVKSIRRFSKLNFFSLSIGSKKRTKSNCDKKLITIFSSDFFRIFHLYKLTSGITENGKNKFKKKKGGDSYPGCEGSNFRK